LPAHLRTKLKEAPSSFRATRDRNYYQSQILFCGNDSKKMWNLINNLLGSKAKELSPPEKLF